MSVTMPEPTQMRRTPTYDFDSAIKRRFTDIQALGDSANQYTQQLANRRTQNQMAQTQQGFNYEYKGTGGNDLRNRLVGYASQFKGTPYKWGGSQPGGFDCSGLIQYVYGKMGVKMPRVSQQQATMGQVTGVQNLRPGDFVAWGSSPATAHHIAIYAGNGMVWEAPHTGAQVRLRPVNPNERGIMGIALGI